jgi:hypothetical protein
MMSRLNCAILMSIFLRLSLLVRTHTIGNIRLFSQKYGESLDDCFDRFEYIISNLHPCHPLAYSDNERAKQLLYALDDHV